MAKTYLEQEKTGGNPIRGYKARVHTVDEKSGKIEIQTNAGEIYTLNLEPLTDRGITVDKLIKGSRMQPSVVPGDYLLLDGPKETGVKFDKAAKTVTANYCGLRQGALTDPDCIVELSQNRDKSKTYCTRYKNNVKGDPSDISKTMNTILQGKDVIGNKELPVYVPGVKAVIRITNEDGASMGVFNFSPFQVGKDCSVNDYVEALYQKTSDIKDALAEEGVNAKFDVLVGFSTMYWNEKGVETGIVGKMVDAMCDKDGHRTKVFNHCMVRTSSEPNSSLIAKIDPSYNREGHWNLAYKDTVTPEGKFLQRADEKQIELMQRVFASINSSSSKAAEDEGEEEGMRPF